MVRDILIDIDSNDIQISENIDKNSLIFDTIWGDLFDGDRDDNIVYLNVIVPSNYIQYLNYTFTAFVEGFLSQPFLLVVDFILFLPFTPPTALVFFVSRITKKTTRIKIIIIEIGIQEMCKCCLFNKIY